MAIFVATDFVVTIDGVDLTDHLVQAQLTTEAAEVETTTFGNTWRSRVGGLKSGSLTLQLNQDFATSKVDDTIWPNLGATVDVTIKPTSGVISATNPIYTVPVVVTGYEIFNSNVGDLATVSITWPTANEVTKAIA